MPPLPDVPKVVRVTQRMTDAADTDIVGRVYMQYTGSAPSNGDLDAYALVAATSWGANLAPLASEAIGLIEVDCEDLTSPSAAVGSWTGSIGGSRSGESLPAGTAFVLQFRILRRYRGGHSRTYWPGGAEGDQESPQTWTAAYQAAMVTGFEAYISSLHGSAWGGSGTVTQVSVSYYTGFTNITTPSGRMRAKPNLRPTPLIDEIVAITPNPHFGSQRRRNLQP